MQERFIMMSLITNYEFFGFIGIIFNLLGFAQTDLKKSLVLNIIAISLFVLNMYFIGVSHGAVLVAVLGLSLSITSLALLNYPAIKDFIIKLSPLIMVCILVLLGFNIQNLIAAFGFLFSTLAKMQKDILWMKFIYILSCLVWLSLGIYIGSPSMILSDIVGFIALIYSIRKIMGEKGLLFSDIFYQRNIS